MYRSRLEALLLGLEVPNVKDALEIDPYKLRLMGAAIAKHQKRMNMLFEKYVVAEAVHAQEEAMPE